MLTPHQQILALLESLRFTRDRELTCDEWLDRLAPYLEAEPSIQQSDHFQLVQQHLEICPDCREEIAMMMLAINAPES